MASPLLARLRADLDTDGVPPSRRIAQLERWINLLDARRNQFFAPIAPFLLWSTQLAFAIEHWRLVSGPALGRWLDVVGAFEALCALSSHSMSTTTTVRGDRRRRSALRRQRHRHPLIPAALCVRNDLHLGRDLLAAIGRSRDQRIEHVGKSTLLRSAGTNAVLALCGAPVRAAASSSPLSRSALDAGTGLAAGRHLALLRRDQRLIGC